MDCLGHAAGRWVTESRQAFTRCAQGNIEEMPPCRISSDFPFIVCPGRDICKDIQRRRAAEAAYGRQRLTLQQLMNLGISIRIQQVKGHKSYCLMSSAAPSERRELGHYQEQQH